MTSINFADWHKATSDLDWGTQRVMHETLNLASEGKIHLVHGADYSGNSACLVNSVAQMLTENTDGLSPSQWFPAVVRAFDRINTVLVSAGVNAGDHFVSEIAASALLANFGPLKSVPTVDDAKAVSLEMLKATESVPYVEPSDTELSEAWDALFTPAPVEALVTPVNDVISEREYGSHAL